MSFSPFRRTGKRDVFTVAFYNLENLFDTKNDPGKLDDDFTPDGKKKWTRKRYKKKIHQLAKTISKLGKKTTGYGPVLVGIAEVENKHVIEDLLKARPLNKDTYSYVHFESPDERGIDTALLYNREYFKPLFTKAVELHITNTNGDRDTTRDILYVHGRLNDEDVHLFVNHWPSRRDGEDITAYKRMKAAETILSFMSEIESDTADPNYIVMGDFNDGPDAESIRHLVSSKNLYNPMTKLASPERGSANYRRTWSLFDQIIVSHSFFNYEKGTHSFTHANIFDDYFLTEWKGKYRGNPFRTYVGKKYKGGYSDHFPVFIQLTYNS